MLELTRMDELHLGNTGRLTGHYQYASWEIQIPNLVVCGASETVLQDKNWEGWADSETPVLLYLRPTGICSWPSSCPVACDHDTLDEDLDS
jgi:hypothetical protein